MSDQIIFRQYQNSNIDESVRGCIDNLFRVPCLLKIEGIGPSDLEDLISLSSDKLGAVFRFGKESFLDVLEDMEKERKKPLSWDSVYFLLKVRETINKDFVVEIGLSSSISSFGGGATVYNMDIFKKNISGISPDNFDQRIITYNDDLENSI